MDWYKVHGPYRNGDGGDKVDGTSPVSDRQGRIVFGSRGGRKDMIPRLLVFSETYLSDRPDFALDRCRSVGLCVLLDNRVKDDVLSLTPQLGVVIRFITLLYSTCRSLREFFF